jgi:hypothetical protein
MPYYYLHKHGTLHYKAEDPKDGVDELDNNDFIVSYWEVSESPSATVGWIIASEALAYQGAEPVQILGHFTDPEGNSILGNEGGIDYCINHLKAVVDIGYMDGERSYSVKRRDWEEGKPIGKGSSILLALAELIRELGFVGRNSWRPNSIDLVRVLR